MIYLGRDHAGFAQPLGIDIQAPGRLAQRFGDDLLPFAGQQPVDENFRRIGMGRGFDDRQVAAAAGTVSAFFQCRHRFDRQASFDERQQAIRGQTDHDRHVALGEILAEQPLIAAEDDVLGDEFF